jgi:replicative DNA helicase
MSNKGADMIYPRRPEPPYCIGTEQAVLGKLLIDSSACDAVIEKLTEDDFFSFTLDHQTIFRAIVQLAREKKPVNIAAVAERIAALFPGSKLDLEYIVELARSTPAMADIDIAQSVSLIKKQSALRSMVQPGNDSLHKTEARLAKSREALDFAEQALSNLSQSHHGRDFAILWQALASCVEIIERQRGSDDSVTGLSTGLRDLDRLTSGLQPGELIVVGGRPSMGKTAFATGLILSVLNKCQEGYVQFHSLDMSVNIILFRLLSSLAHIPAWSLRLGRLSNDDWERLSDALDEISKLDNRLLIDDSTSLTPTELRTKTLRTARKRGSPRLIVVDYLQLMRTDVRSGNHELDLSEITASLKALALEMRCPVVVLSQLNRALERRDNKRPILSDLRGSGAIESDADLIALIYRDEVYNPDSTERGSAEIIISKNRNGPIGAIRTTFIGNQVRFVDFPE